MGAIAEVKQEWKHFKDDPPGERFSNHRRRMQRKPRGHSLIALLLGILLVAGGVVLLFIPGPGSVLIVFGFALIASHSKKLSALMDRMEPKLRAFGHRTVRRWKAMPRQKKVILIAAVAAFAAAGLLFMWRFVVSAYLLG